MMVRRSPAETNLYSPKHKSRNCFNLILSESYHNGGTFSCRNLYSQKHKSLNFHTIFAVGTLGETVEIRAEGIRFCVGSMDMHVKPKLDYHLHIDPNI